MVNCFIKYQLNQDGVITEDSLTGKYEKVGSLYRVTFVTKNDGAISEHSYVKISNNAFKISVKGDTEYSLRVAEGENSNATMKTGEVVFPFISKAIKCQVESDDFGMKIYAEYDIIAFNQSIKNSLTLVVNLIGDLKC